MKNYFSAVLFLAMAIPSASAKEVAPASVRFVTLGFADGAYYEVQGSFYESHILTRLPQSTKFGITFRHNDGPEFRIPNWQTGSKEYRIVPNDAIGKYTITSVFVESDGATMLVWWGEVSLIVVPRGKMPIEAMANGNAGLAPTDVPADVIGVRYRFKVMDNEETTAMKIIFVGTTVGAPDNDKRHHLESNVFSTGLRHGDDTCATWPPLGEVTAGQSSLSLNFSDYNLSGSGSFGAKTSERGIFPRQRIFIDGSDIQALGMRSQVNLNGKEVAVEILHGGIVTDRSGWDPCTIVPLVGEFREWIMRADFDGGSYTVRFALPAETVHMKDVMMICTEFLSYHGLFRLYIWSPEVLQERQEFWQPLLLWRVHYSKGGGMNPDGFGFRQAMYQGRPAIEVSNDGGKYLKPGETLSLIQAIPIPGAGGKQ